MEFSRRCIGKLKSSIERSAERISDAVCCRKRKRNASSSMMSMSPCQIQRDQGSLLRWNHKRQRLSESEQSTPINLINLKDQSRPSLVSPDFSSIPGNSLPSSVAKIDFADRVSSPEIQPAVQIPAYPSQPAKRKSSDITDDDFSMADVDSLCEVDINKLISRQAKQMKVLQQIQTEGQNQVSRYQLRQRKQSQKRQTHISNQSTQLLENSLSNQSMARGLMFATPSPRVGEGFAMRQQPTIEIRQKFDLPDYIDISSPELCPAPVILEDYLGLLEQSSENGTILITESKLKRIQGEWEYFKFIIHKEKQDHSTLLIPKYENNQLTLLYISATDAMEITFQKMQTGLDQLREQRIQDIVRTLYGQPMTQMHKTRHTTTESQVMVMGACCARWIVKENPLAASNSWRQVLDDWNSLVPSVMRPDLSKYWTSVLQNDIKKGRVWGKERGDAMLE